MTRNESLMGVPSGTGALFHTPPRYWNCALTTFSREGHLAPTPFIPSASHGSATPYATSLSCSRGARHDVRRGERHYA